MASIIQVRQDTAANWASVNPTLADGEYGYEKDTGKLKIGNGTNNWTTLACQIGTAVPENAVFTDTQVTVEDVLTSTSSTNGLSANMGKQLQDTKVGSDITTIPTGGIVTNMFKCTQAEYDGITPDANTFYIIVN